MVSSSVKKPTGNDQTIPWEGGGSLRGPLGRRGFPKDLPLHMLTFTKNELLALPSRGRECIHRAQHSAPQVMHVSIVSAFPPHMMYTCTYPSVHLHHISYTCKRCTHANDVHMYMMCTCTYPSARLPLRTSACAVHVLCMFMCTRTHLMR